MELDHYDINNYPGRDDVYWFKSKGLQREVIKIVEIQEMDVENRYNLSLGDYTNGEVNYSVISNNRDTKVVMASIALIVEEYTKQHPERELFVIGDTPLKTRLYQMHLSNNLHEIQKEFYVWGQRDIGMEFEIFEKGKQYTSFLVKRK